MKFVPNAVTSTIARAALKSSKASPQVLFVSGIVGMGATVVLACRATLKVEEVLERTEKKLMDVKEVQSGAHVLSNGQTYNDSDAKKDTAVIYLRAAVDLGKLYGPSIIVGTISIACLSGSHNILNKRNASLVAAYGAIEKAFDQYRGRVREAYGEKREEEIYLDVLPCEIDDPDTGKITKRKIAHGGSPYSKLFDEHNVNWESTPEYNFMFLKLRQSTFNQRLQAKGHLFLNEVYDDLGFERTKEGAVVGWIKGNGDDYVDLGIFNREMEEKILDFMVGRESAIWLDFNVDGLIFDKI